MLPLPATVEKRGGDSRNLTAGPSLPVTVLTHLETLNSKPF